MIGRPKEQQAALAKLVVEGWQFADELPRLRLVIMAKITRGMDGVTRAEFVSVGRNGTITKTGGPSANV